MPKYKVLGHGQAVNVNGVDHVRGDILEMSVEEAADALSNSKIELVEDGGEVISDNTNTMSDEVQVAAGEEVVKNDEVAADQGAAAGEVAGDIAADAGAAAGESTVAGEGEGAAASGEAAAQ